MMDVPRLKEGFLVKKGHVRHNWRTRWFALTPNSLEYYKQKTDKLPAGTIQLDGCALISPTPDYSKRTHVMRLIALDGKEFMIEAPDAGTHKEWVDSISEIITKLGSRKSTETFSSQVKKQNLDLPANSEILEAMQDPEAGVPLSDHKSRLKTYKHCFAGCELIEWFLSWSFVSTRESGVYLANSLLKEGLIQPVGGISKESFRRNAHLIKRDSFMDHVGALYRFSALKPSVRVECHFGGSGSGQDTKDATVSLGNEEEESDEEDEPVPHCVRDKHKESKEIVCQGFLMKKGHKRRNWKARKFVLKKDSEELLYYKGSKPDPVGYIRLRGAEVQIVNPFEGDEHFSKSRVDHLFHVRTESGIIYLLQASSDVERDNWIKNIVSVVTRVQ
ncbi:pleckstrin-like [Oscarella lobularis]|uniref:pleckstrin-like n=1 Tax=Oscarella lobularis TaxID=121494 RepID=UPI00331414CB